ncbi:hypothetical protein [Pseudomonas sp. 1928-m]|uniref:hypothetical protein n=1 Tax=Pseudomonas sp. 1928-m TaxID=3033804 RepID=UPI0023DE7DFC|nr:hypothetical protein [Pseudomonas sp. 1928-m]MDF3196438.1 hypothetical protein [Pseudomonas sp. 1928-m]
MSRYLPLIALLIAAALCLALSFVLRYQLMEGAQWVGLCVDAPQQLACQVRASLGWLIHFRILAWAALIIAVLAFVLPGAWSKRLAVPALLLALPALVLYSASLAVFAVVLALLRWVRAPQTA